MEATLTALLDLSHSAAGGWLAGFQYPQEALDGIKDFILTYGMGLDPAENTYKTGGVIAPKKQEER